MDDQRIDRAGGVKCYWRRFEWSVVAFIVFMLAELMAPTKVKSGRDFIVDEMDPRWMWPILAIFVLTLIAIWIPRRFSLRTLLTVTTLVAIALGAIIWAANK